jgi:hypothetical protein
VWWFLVILKIKKKHSTGLSDRLRERERVEKDPAFVASSTGSRFIGTKPRETNRLCYFVSIITLRFDSSSSLSLNSLAHYFYAQD